jgi:hypothetical protein
MATATHSRARWHRRYYLATAGLLLCAVYLFHASRDVERLENYLGGKGCSWLQGNADHSLIAHSIWFGLLGASTLNLSLGRSEMGWRRVAAGIFFLLLLHMMFPHFWDLFPESDKPYCLDERRR